MKKPSGIRSGEKLNIGFVFDDSLDSTDGVAQYVKTLGEWFTAKNHHVSYLVGETKLKNLNGGQVFSLSKNVPVNFNNNRLTIPLPAKKAPIRSLMASENFDVIHVQVPYSPFMAQHVISMAGKKTAVIGTFHILPAGWPAKWGARSLRYLLSRSLKRFDSIISVSPAASEFARSVFGIKTEVIPNTINIEKFKSTKKTSDSMRIVFLGRLVERKGCLELLKAFKQVNQKNPTVKLIIAGKGPDNDKLVNFVKKNKLENNVEFRGFVAEKDKPAILSSADIACFPSTGGESFGIVLLEAMAAGAGLVIGGNNPGYRSVLGEKPQLLFDPKDTEAFAAKLIEFLEDTAARKKLHAWQASLIRQYDVGVIGPKILDIYMTAKAKRDKINANA